MDFQRAVFLAEDLRTRLHGMPEPSGAEVRTKACLQEFLSEYSDLEITDMGSWFYASHREADAGESIAFRADMDAVTGPDGNAGHLCGHDGHSAALAGFGAALRGRPFGKNLFLIFQHAEESGAGGRACAHEFLERENPDWVFAFHNLPGQPSGAVILKEGTFACASEGLILEFTGSPAHAAYPEDGRNPAFAISALVQELPQLSAPEAYRGMVRCTVIQIHVGEPAFGVSAGQGKLLLTIRAALDEDLKELKRRIIGRGEALAARDGLAFSGRESDVFPDTRNDASALKRVEEVCAVNGLASNQMAEPNRWSEDFGWFLKKIPGVMVGIGSGIGHAPLHTAEYEFPDEILERAMALWMGIAESESCGK